LSQVCTSSRTAACNPRGVHGRLVTVGQVGGEVVYRGNGGGTTFESLPLLLDGPSRS
jgi:hypothetical protein